MIRFVSSKDLKKAYEKFIKIEGECDIQFEELVAKMPYGSDNLLVYIVQNYANIIEINKDMSVVKQLKKHEIDLEEYATYTTFYKDYNSEDKYNIAYDIAETIVKSNINRKGCRDGWSRNY